MRPTLSQVKLLEQIDEGKHGFGPEDNSEEALKRFQPLAEELIELSEEGCISGCNPHRESSTGKDFIDRVMVKGLTAEGRRTMIMHQGIPGQMSPEEYRVKLEKKVKYWKDAVDRIHTVLQDTRLSESERLAKATDAAVDAKLIPEDRDF